jgi:hypothetical protein
LKLRVHHGHEVHDDAGGDVRNYTQRENTHAFPSATREHVEQFENSALILVEQRRKLARIDARHGDVCTYPVDEQGKKHEQQTAAEFCDPRLVASQLVGHVCLIT